MPPKGKLADSDIAVLERWVAMGAPTPAPRPRPPRPRGPTSTPGRAHWAFQPTPRRPCRAVKDTAWPRSDIDRFILARLEAEGPGPGRRRRQADLLRRVYFDLTACRRRPAEVDAFLADDAPDALREGRRCAAGLAPNSASAGAGTGSTWPAMPTPTARTRTSPTTTPGAIRDYVIAAFNADKPFDRFLPEQLAGDLLPVRRPQDERDEQLIATGFLVVGPKVIGATDKEQDAAWTWSTSRSTRSARRSSA